MNLFLTFISCQRMLRLAQIGLILNSLSRQWPFKCHDIPLLQHIKQQELAIFSYEHNEEWWRIIIISHTQGEKSTDNCSSRHNTSEPWEHDGVPCHKKLISYWFSGNNFCVLYWLGYSSKLNPMENVGLTVKNQVECHNAG